MSEFYYEPPAEPDVDPFEIPGHRIQAARDWLIAGTEYEGVEGMYPEQVVETIIECYGSWEAWDLHEMRVMW